MPTTYPKCTPSELQGLVVLLNSHSGTEDVARLADDLDLEIDEILPAVEYASVLQLVKVQDGRASLTDVGKRYLAGTIRDRKALLRDQLRRTTLFRTLLRALESSPTGSLTDDELTNIVSVTSASQDQAVQNIVNWGRYAELFRYDAAQHLLVVAPHTSTKTSGGARPPPPSASNPPPPTRPAAKPSRTSTEGTTHTSPVAIHAI